MMLIATALWKAFEPLLEPLGKALGYLIIGGSVALAIFLFGEHTANQKHEAAELQRKIRDMTVIQVAASADRIRLVQQQRQIEDLKKEIENGKAQLHQPDNACFDTGDVDQLRKLWR